MSYQAYQEPEEEYYDDYDEECEEDEIDYPEDCCDCVEDEYADDIKRHARDKQGRLLKSGMKVKFVGDCITTDKLYTMVSEMRRTVRKGLVVDITVLNPDLISAVGCSWHPIDCIAIVEDEEIEQPKPVTFDPNFLDI